LQHRVRPFVALLALVFAAFALAACGSSGSNSSGGGGSNATSLVDQTFSGSHPIHSGKVKLAFSLQAPGSSTLKDPVQISFSGPFQSQGPNKLPKFAFALSFQAKGTSLDAGATSTGDKGFVNFRGTNYAVPTNVFAQFKSGYEQSKNKSASGATKRQGLSTLGVKPLNWLQNPVVKGDETVGGTTTTHIVAALNESAFLDDVDKLLGKAGSVPGVGAAAARLPKHLTPAQRSKITKAIKSSTLELWTGKSDKTLRKLAVAVALDPTALGKSAGGATSAQIAFSLEFDDLNQPQTITAPTGTHPLSELLGQFQGLLGALGGLGGAGSGGTTTPGAGGAAGAGTSQNVQKYAQCIQAAGSNVAQAQQCAALLSK
jgi:hypothetical protein